MLALRACASGEWDGDGYATCRCDEFEVVCHRRVVYDCICDHLAVVVMGSSGIEIEEVVVRGSL